MRTTVTLDADTEAMVRRLMEHRQISFKQALNDAIRRGAGAPPVVDVVTSVRRMGEPTVNLDRALQLHGDLEDEEIVRRMRTGQ